MLLVSIIDPSKEDVTRLSALIERHFRRSSTAYVQRVYQSGMEFVRSAENSDIVFLETNLESWTAWKPPASSASWAARHS